MDRHSTRWPIAGRRTRATLLGVAAVAATMALAGCGGGGSNGQGTTPSGYTRVTVSGISLAYPSSWQSASGGTANVIAQVSQGGQAVGQLGVVPNITNLGSGDTRDLAPVVEAGPENRYPGYHRNGQKNMKVPGASAAVRTDYVYTTTSDGGTAAGQDASGTDVGLLTKNGTVDVVRITGLAGKIDSTMIDNIVQSIKVTGS